MKRNRHLLFDVFVMTLPVLGVMGYVLLAAAASFYNAEIKNFHGDAVGPLRVGGPQTMLAAGLEPLVNRPVRRWLPDRPDPAAPNSDDDAADPPIVDLRVDGTALDALSSDLPASAEKWERGELVVNGLPQRVKVRYRGQLMSRYFWKRKAWKIETRKRELVDGFRKINLTPIGRSRLASHLTFMVGREVGLAAPRSRFVRLFLNGEDQGVYLQEEQIDESMIRANQRMPGDVFYGELYMPDEPKMSSAELFWNPFLWEKDSRNNRYPDEYRPHLTDLLDCICDGPPSRLSDENGRAATSGDSPSAWADTGAGPIRHSTDSFARLYRLLDMDKVPLYFAVLAFQGDRHIDDIHNQKLYFNPLTGRFEPLLWNPLFNMGGENAVESMNNRFFRKLVQDPRFLDLVHRQVYERLILGGMTDRQLRELDSIERTIAPFVLDRDEFLADVAQVRQSLLARAERFRSFYEEASVHIQAEPLRDVTRLHVFGRAVASLRLKAITLVEEPDACTLWEDRDFNGRLSEADRQLPVKLLGNDLTVESNDALIYTGRDLRGLEPNHGSTRLAFLKSSYLLVPPQPGRLPKVVGITAERTVGEGKVAVRQGAPDDYVAVETVHPWRLSAPEPPREYRFEGSVALAENLIVRPGDRFEAKPGTTFRLGPGVSMLFHRDVHLSNVNVRRLDPDRPWGVVALQGPEASGSLLEGCRFSGGSEATIGHVYYSGMLSVHYADRVVVRNSEFSGNLLGDDTVRFARCDHVLVENTHIGKANGDAIDFDLCSGRLAECTIADSCGDGIDLMTSQIDVERARITTAGDKGISVGEASHPTISDSSIRDCVTGLGIKDGSDPTVRNVDILACRVGVNSYDKNWRYPGGGRGRLVQCTLRGNGVDVRLDDRSTLIMERCVSEGAYELPAAAPPEQLQVTDRREAETPL